jgi:probable DNA metabolism protein
VDLTVNFYRRNYIEGLFLSSGVWRSPDETMERLVRVIATLRQKHRFNGYIHLKGIPGADAELFRQAGTYADRLSVNIELPTERSLHRLAVGKTYADILNPMQVIRAGIEENRADRSHFRSTPQFAPAGQSTQLIVGASPETDWEILRLADRLYEDKRLRRVYYSGYIPVNTEDGRLPQITEPPLLRENRLYQADWLIRLYGFALEDLVNANAPRLPQEIDPKYHFALQNAHLFPVDINRAEYEMLLKVPGIGLKSARRIIKYRRRGTIRFEHLRQMGVVLKRAAAFIRCPGHPDGTLKWTKNAAALCAAKTCLFAPKENVKAIRYDGSFEGLLTVFSHLRSQTQCGFSIISTEEKQVGLFEADTILLTDAKVAAKVWQTLKRRCNTNVLRDFYCAFLSGERGVEGLLHTVYRALVNEGLPPGPGDRTSAMLKVEKLSHRVRLEAHRLRGFVRFEKTESGLYIAFVAPVYNVLPLIRRHFERRFSDQRWIICDTKREYGFHFDTEKSYIIRIPEMPSQDQVAKGRTDTSYRDLWKDYFRSLTIHERKNLSLQLRQLPRRYWNYLPEID